MFSPNNCRDLKKSQAILNGLKQISIISSTDKHGTITEVNDRFCEISGYQPSELIGKNHRIINSGTHNEAFFKAMWDRITSGKIWRGEICNKKKSGELYWVDATVIPIKEDDGTIVAFTSIRLEITDRKLLEQKLLAESQKMHLVLDSSDLGTWDWNPSTNKVEFDEYWCRQLGLDQKSIKMDLSTWNERVHPDEMAACYADIQKHIDGKAPSYENIHRVKHADGRWRWILDRGKVVARDERGQPVRFIGTHSDITKQKEKELEYKQGLETKHAILKSARFSIITTDTNGIITGFNEEAERILGYKASEMIGIQTPLAFHDQEEMVTAAQTLSASLGVEIKSNFGVFVAIANLETFNEHQWTYIRKDGKHVQIRLSISVLHDTKGNISGYLGIAKDMTEELATKKMIELQRAQLHSASKMAALGEMAAGIAHEVNNPLAIIAGKANLLLQALEKNQPLDNEKLKDALEKIVRNSFRASQIITSLKTLSRNADSDPMHTINIRSVINDALAICTEKFKHEGIDLFINIQSNSLFRGRTVQISQVLTNLLNNAYDAVKNLKTKWVEIKAVESGPFLFVSVTDSGTGIPEDVQNKLMQPFFTTKEVGKGTGLGLSISRKIAEDHHGDLFLDIQNPNTKFVLKLPLAEGPQAQIEAP